MVVLRKGRGVGGGVRRRAASVDEHNAHLRICVVERALEGLLVRLRGGEADAGEDEVRIKSQALFWRGTYRAPSALDRFSMGSASGCMAGLPAPDRGVPVPALLLRLLLVPSAMIHLEQTSKDALECRPRDTTRFMVTQVEIKVRGFRIPPSTQALPRSCYYMRMWVVPRGDCSLPNSA